MGRKQRRNRRKDDDDFSEEEAPDNQEAVSSSPPKESLKDLDFVERRELQRKQAAEKRRSKMKCYLCGKAGHVRRQCPGVRDDGRGMSRYKGKSNTKLEKQKYQAKKYGGGGDTDTDPTNGPALQYPEALQAADLGFYYYDVSCDVQATMDYCKQGRGKAKISQNEAFQEYQQALLDADEYTNFGGMISKSILKPNRPWIAPESPLPEKTWYMIGLARDFLYNDAENEAAIQMLVDTLNNHKDQVVGYWAVLDYTPEYCQRPGCDKESQLRRVNATCQAAGQAEVTVQVQVLPGAAGLTEVAGTDYAQVLMELQSLLTQITVQYPQLQIVLTDWAGMAPHMMSLLQGFPHNLSIGLDGAVSFSKASHLHECAFEIPLDRLVLETATLIPSDIANALGRDAFFHSGLWPFVAQAVAHSKKTVPIEEVARAVSEVTLKLYPQLALREERQDEGDDDEDSHEMEDGEENGCGGED